MRDRSPRTFPIMRAMTIGLAGLAFARISLRTGGGICRAAGGPASADRRSHHPRPMRSHLHRAHRRTIDRYCVTCHNEKLKTAGLMLDVADVANPGAGAEVWEKVVRKLRTSTMPPPNMPQPSVEERGALVSWLETTLDQAAAAQAESRAHGDAAPSESH